LLKSVTDDLVLVDSGKATEFDGDLDDYSLWLKNREQAQSTPKAEDKPDNRKDKRKQSAEQRKQLQPLKRIVDKHEKEMDLLTKRAAELEKQLADPDIYSEQNKEKLKALLLKKSDIDGQLEETEMAWMDAAEEYEQAMS
jgi:ATP-binding cassette subfamily F protein 3